MMNRAWLLASLALFAVGCRGEADSSGARDDAASPARTIEAGRAADRDTAEQETAEQDAAPEDPTLALGDSIYQAWCTSCHTPYPPESKPADEWFGTVRKMQQIAEMQGYETLTQEQLFAVTDYLEAQARAAEPSGR